MEKYPTLCRQVENMFPRPQGDIEKRPGTKKAAVRPITEVDNPLPYAAYELTYISENGRIWGFPTINITVSGLDATKASHGVPFDAGDEDNPLDVGDAITSGAKSAVVDGITYTTATTGTIAYTLDGGSADFADDDVLTDGTNSVTVNGTSKTALPFTGHPFDDGWTIRVMGTTSYDGTETVQTGSEGTNYILITAGFSSETFDGTERVTRYFSLTSGLGRSCQDSSGVVYFGHSRDVANNDSCITKILTDGTIVYNPLTPSGGWPTDKAYTAHDVKIYNDETLYVYIVGSTTNRLYSFDLATGNQNWLNLFSSVPGYQMGVDSSGNVYICNTGDLIGLTREAAKFDVSDGTKTSMPGTRNSTYALWVDTEMSYGGVQGVLLVGAGKETGAFYDGYNLHISTLDGSQTGAASIGSGTIGSGHIWTYNNHIYIVDITGEKLYKLDTNLTVVDSVSIPYIQGGYYDLWGNLVIVSADAIDTIDYLFTWLDPDDISGGILATEDFRPNYSPDSPLKGWDAAVGGIYQHGGIFFWPGIEASDPAYYSPQTYLANISDYAIKIVPFEYYPFNYILEFGKNYIGFYRGGDQVDQ